jgi:PhoH-like ATPase
MAAQKKFFVLDTNVILHDSSCINQFEEHDVVLPISILEELDRFKKGNDSVNFHAREFLRVLDKVSGEKIFGDGVKLGPRQGKIIIKLDRDFHPDISQNFNRSNPDHRILNVAYYLSKENPERQVIMVSKDVNLRMKAKAIGLVSEDYTTDHVRQDMSEFYRGYRLEENIDAELISQLYQKPCTINVDDLSLKRPLIPNEYVILRNGKHSALAGFDAENKVLRHVEKGMAYGIKPRNAEQIFALDALMHPGNQMVSLSGKAGTGKTLLALAAALESRKQYRQIYIARPIVPLSNKDSGFLPGDINEKLGPYMQPLFDNLGVIQNQFLDNDARFREIKTLQEEDKLVIAPLSYIRGRSLVNVFFIVDEAQNLTPHEIKTIVTRAGEGTKMVFTGDIFQIDHPYLDTYSNGLSYLIDRMQGQKLYAHMNLEKGERSELAELASNLL